MSRTDRRGEPTSAGSQEEVDAFDEGFELFLNYEMAAGGAMKQVVADHPSSVLAAVLRGYMMLMLESVALQPKVSATVEAIRAEASHANERERLHLDALGAWAGGDVRAAARVWDRILAAHPRDLLALKLHHYTTFWTGRANVLVSAVDGVLDAWDDDTPGLDHVLGMQAFGLNETGRHEEAEQIGRQAVAANAEDLWSIHAVAHALEMQGDLGGGDAFFAEVSGGGDDDRWSAKNPFIGHIWWHAALFPWNRGDYDRVLALYDERLRPASTEFFLDLQNLSSLLTRLELAGVDVGDRWDELGDHAAGRIGDHVLTFTDVHCALTLWRTDRRQDLRAFTASLEAHRAARPAGVDHAGLDVAIGLAKGFEHRADGDAAAATEAWLDLRGDLAPIGGSHAQRDLFDLVLVDAAADAGDTDLTLNLLRARTRRWPNSVPTWHRYATALTGAGRQDDAEQANRRAMEASNR